MKTNRTNAIITNSYGNYNILYIGGVVKKTVSKVSTILVYKMRC